MRLFRLAVFSLSLAAILLLINASQNEAHMSSVISKLKGVFTSSNNSSKNDTQPTQNTQHDHNPQYHNVNSNNNQAPTESKHRHAPNSNTGREYATGSNQSKYNQQQQHQGLNINDHKDKQFNNVEFIDQNADYGQKTRDGDTRIPFWNIAHMVNSIEQVDHMLG